MEKYFEDEDKQRHKSRQGVGNTLAARQAGRQASPSRQQLKGERRKESEEGKNEARATSELEPGTPPDGAHKHSIIRICG